MGISALLKSSDDVDTLLELKKALDDKLSLREVPPKPKVAKVADTPLKGGAEGNKSALEGRADFKKIIKIGKEIARKELIECKKYLNGEVGKTLKDKCR